MSFMYYVLPNHTDMKINIYDHSLKTFDKIAKEEIDSLGELMSDFFTGYELDNRLEKMLDMNEHMQHMALPRLL